MRFLGLLRPFAAGTLWCAAALFGQELGDAPIAPPIPNTLKHGVAHATAAPFAAADWYDTSNREAIRTAYSSLYAPTNGTPLGYVGSPATGVAGDTSTAYKSAVLTRINFFRAMGGVPSISGLDAVWNAKDQLGALMLYANQALSHSPPANWARYTADGAEALGKSNICQGMQSDAGCVSLFMDDHGSNNTAVGHRRWFLYPQTQKMGTGDIPDSFSRLWNAVWVVEESTVWNARPATREPYIAWPPKGYVPYQMVYNRWSFHYPGASFAAATVSVSRSGSPLPVRIDSAASTTGMSAPDNQIVFVLDNASTTNPTTAVNPGADTTYTVTISNVNVDGNLQTFTYNVIVFDPATAGPQVGPGAPSVVSFSPLSGSGTTGTFTAMFQQSSGNHYLGYMLFLPTPNIVWYTATGSCLIEYNRYSNGVRLINNAGTGWLGGQSGIPIGPGAGVLTNNQCSVNVANVVASVSGHSMTVTAPVTFFGALGPVVGTFMQGLDSNGVWTGMTQFGSWNLPGAAQTRIGPTIAGVSSTATSGTQATYTVTASHTGGANQLSMIHLLTSAAIVGSPACQFVYFPAANTLNLINDAGTELVSPTGIVPGQPGSLTNGRCSANAAASSRTLGVNTVTLMLPITYKPAFAGQKRVYVNAFDNSGSLTHWVQGSSMLVQ